MKIRNGFVSNSSSSSFICYGKHLSCDDIEKFIKKNSKNELYIDKNNEIDFESDGICEIMYSIKLPENICYEGCYDNEEHYLGRKYETMRDDETYGEFKKTTNEAIQKMLENDKIVCGHIEEAWTAY